jgi:ABC-2 type transport system ATP-binding protein
MALTLAVPEAPSVAPATPAIALEGVSYRYADRVALDAVSLTVPRGVIFGLLGPNGSGKSTLLSLLIGRRAPDEGEVRLLGEPVSPGLRARVGSVFQEPSLDPLMTVGETMRLHARLFGLARERAVAETTRLLASLGLADRVQARTGTLSGGLRRRLELARALLPSPELLLLDEPTLALDPDARQALWRGLIAANAAGATLLLATNDVAEAERYCSAVALLDQGRLVAGGVPTDLKRDLRRDAVRIDWHEDPAARVAMLMSWEGVGAVRLAGLTTHVTVDAAAPFLTRVFRECGEHIHTVQIEPSTLEDVYFQLVGRGIAPEALVS